MNTRHTKETKQQAIIQWQLGKSILAIAKSTNIHRSTIYRWINEFKAETKQKKKPKV